MNTEKDVTGLLSELRNGSQGAYEEVLPLIYNHLRELANRQLQKQLPGHTYSKTDLVHETYLKLVAHPPNLDLKSRAHFFGIAAQCMRSILIDYARKKSAEKRGGRQQAETYIDHLISAEAEADYLIELDGAMQKLDKIDKRLLRIVELRYFAEMGINEIAEIMEVSSRTVKRDWAKARGLLYKELKTG